MRLSRTVASLLLAALALTACGRSASRTPPEKDLPVISPSGVDLSKTNQAPPATQPAPAPTPAPETTPAPAPTPVTPATQTPAGTAQSPQEQAAALLNQGNVAGAIAILERTVAADPTADNYNLLAYAYLTAGRYREAYDAGQKAIKLNEKHPVALYNTGMAALQLGELEAAQGYLQQAVEISPDRYEAHLGLALVYGVTGRYALAKYEADQAERYGPGQPEIASVKAKLAEMPRSSAPANLATGSTARLTDGSTTLYLYGDRKNGYTVYAVTAQSTSGLPVGPVDFDASAQFKAVSLPGGVRGYLLSGPDTQAFVARASEWRLFALVGGRLQQVLFLDPKKQEHYQPQVSDFLRAGGPPSVQNSNIVAQHQDDASGQHTVTITYRLDLDRLTATLTDVRYQ